MRRCRYRGSCIALTSTTTDGDNLRRVGYNIYVVKTSPTTLVAAGNCSAANPCPIWNDTYLAGFDYAAMHDHAAGRERNGLHLEDRIGRIGCHLYQRVCQSATDTCPLADGNGFPGGSMPLWTWAASSGTWAASGSDNRGGSSGYFGRHQSEDSTDLGVLRDAAADRREQRSHGRRSERHGLGFLQVLRGAEIRRVPDCLPAGRYLRELSERSEARWRFVRLHVV